MISQTVEYALRAVAFLATTPDEPQTGARISEATKVPSGYMAKVLQTLARHNILHAQRGLHGGFTLEQDPETLTMLDVVNAIDPIKRVERCPLGLPSHVKLCPLHRRLDEALKHIEDAFASTTIASLLEDREGEPRPLCEVTVAGKRR